MSNKANHRRTHQRVREEAPWSLRSWTSNGGVQGASRGRRRWKRIRNRTLRRTGKYLRSPFGKNEELHDN